MSKLKDIDKTNQITAFSRVGPKIPKIDEKAKVMSKMKQDVWKPPAWEPARPGADDHKQFKSKGM